MKKLITLLLAIIFLCGCRNNFESKFDLYVDSANCMDKCFWNQKYGTPEYEYYYKEANRFSDSVHFYYHLIYPNGNPADKIVLSTENINCNCK